MTWQKASIILAVIVSLSVVGKVTYQFAVKVDSVFAAVEKTDRRHNQEDLVFLWKRKKDLEDKRDAGDWMPADVDAVMRLEALIKELEKDLGY